jgi:sulfite reductase (NADPH) flavoprotein alpha-component
MDFSLRLLLATMLCLAWGLLAARAWRRASRRSGAIAPTGGGTLPVIYASQTGYAAGLALQAVQAIGTDKAQAVALEKINPAFLQQAGRALFIISTTGEGDPPDSAWPFVSRHMAGSAPRLDGVHYGLLALGDRRYRHFCGFGQQMRQWLQAGGARPLFAPVLADSEDAGSMSEWTRHLAQHFGATPSAHASETPPWRLQARRLVNAGSLGQPCYLLTFVCKGDTLAWQAGDIARVAIPGTGEWRDYSIASLPADGVLQLLIRLQKGPDGNNGKGSGWLTQTLPLGGNVQICLRQNPGFHLLPGEAPAIFIGNGTGIAGLRSLLKARMAQGLFNNWLILGERQAGIDEPFGEELRRLAHEGCIAPLHLTFSRDGKAPRYVYEALALQRDSLCQWVDRDAAIYVCGSRQGMAADVDSTLRQVLGETRYHALRLAGRYRRDVY